MGENIPGMNLPLKHENTCSRENRVDVAEMGSEAEVVIIAVDFREFHRTEYDVPGFSVRHGNG
jgi:hypothetical protein